MRLLVGALTFLAVVLTLGTLQAQQKKAPDKLVFKSKFGAVTFLHAKHTDREKGDCKVCHDVLWPQDAKAPLNYAAGMHKPAEAKKTSCAACHVAGGKSFASTGNCNKCHVKAAPKG